MTTKHTGYHPTKTYYIADPSYWPLVGSVGLFCTVLGFVNTLHHNTLGPFILIIGVLILTVMMFGWFGQVIRESETGLHSKQMDRTYRWAMLWFILSEVMLFGVFFGALFYTRVFVLPELSNTVGPLMQSLMLSEGAATHEYLWPNFQYVWPLLQNPNPALFKGPVKVVETWGIPAVNTLLLLSSAVTLTWAHWGLKKNSRKQLIVGLILTIILGLSFVSLQAHEYILAYTEYHLTLASGIYGATFFMLTGLHAMHVTLGLTMILVILVRCLKGHFRPEHHFGFEAVSWYWHFVDVVWLILFVFVYWI